MEKITNFKDHHHNSMFTRSFRELVAEHIGELDTATSFMYLYRRFGKPTYDNSDEYKILYDYRLEHEDILISIRASYNQFVDFNLFVPQERINEWLKSGGEWDEDGAKIETVPGLKEQCIFIVNELKRGYFVRDAPINILGYESKTNIIKEFEN